MVGGWPAGAGRARAGPPDHGVWRAAQEDECGEQVLLQLQLAQLVGQEDVGAEPEHVVHVGQLVIPDGVSDAKGVLTDELGYNRHHRHIEPDDAGGATPGPPLRALGSGSHCWPLTAPRICCGGFGVLARGHLWGMRVTLQVGMRDGTVGVSLSARGLCDSDPPSRCFSG